MKFTTLFDLIKVLRQHHWPSEVLVDEEFFFLAYFASQPQQREIWRDEQPDGTCSLFLKIHLSTLRLDGIRKSEEPLDLRTPPEKATAA